MYQRVGKAAYKFTLGNTLELDEYFEHPHRQFTSIHIAGTNGKGSVAHMLASVLQSSGYRTGLYTSPHLKDFRERIRINGQPVPGEEVTAFVSANRAIMEKIRPSFFEATVAMAFDHFARERIDIAVIETGMGGRLDSTNIITPLVSVITNIGMDHSSFLGDTLAAIAFEKAGIMKPGVPVVIGEKQEETAPVFLQRAEELNCPLHYAGDEFSIDYSTLNSSGKQVMQVYREGKIWLENLELDQLGMYQRKNAATALKVIDLMNRSGPWKAGEKALREGFVSVSGLTGLRGRWEILSRDPLVVCDTAHNPDGMREAVAQIRQTAWKNLHVIIGFVDDKDPAPVLKEFPREALFYFTQASVPRAMDKEKLAMEALRCGIRGKVCMTPASALELARGNAGRHDMIFLSGSTFIVAEVL